MVYNCYISYIILSFKERMDEIMGEAGKEKCKVIMGELNAMSTLWLFRYNMHE